MEVPATQEEKATMPGLGDPVLFKYEYQVTVHSAYVSKRTVEDDRKTNLCLNVTIENASTYSAVTTDSYLDAALLFDVNSKEYQRNASLPVAKKLMWITLQPGESVNGVLVFTVNRDFISYVLTNESNQYFDKRQIYIDNSEIDASQNDSAYYRMGELVPYTNYSVIIKSAVKSSGPDGQRLTLRYTIQNTTKQNITDQTFLQEANLSTVQGRMEEKAKQDGGSISSQTIPPGKMIDGELSFLVQSFDEDFLVFLNTPLDPVKCQVLITKNQITQ